MEGIILAAGKGSRIAMGKYSEVCKALIEVEGTPLIVFSLRNLAKLGVKSTTVVIGKNHKGIRDLLGDSFEQMKLNYAVQEKPVGLINALICAKDYVNDGVFLQLSDEIFFGPKIDGAFCEKIAEYDFAVGYTHDSAEKISQNFSLKTDGNMKILSCVEKPKTVTNDLKGTGFCYFSKECYDMIVDSYDAETNTPSDLCDFINLLVKNGKNGRAVHIADEEVNVNTQESLLYARQRIKEAGDTV